MRDCPTCNEETLPDYDRPSFKSFAGTNAGTRALREMFTELFEALETDERCKDTQHFMFEKVVELFFKNPSEFWDYVNQFGREW